MDDERSARIGHSEVEPVAERRASTWLQAAIEMQIDPQVLLLAVRDPSGRIVDLEYGDANQSACDYYGLPMSTSSGRGCSTSRQTRWLQVCSRSAGRSSTPEKT